MPRQCTSKKVTECNETQGLVIHSEDSFWDPDQDSEIMHAGEYCTTSCNTVFICKMHARVVAPPAESAVWNQLSSPSELCLIYTKSSDQQYDNSNLKFKYINV
jgi:hypothetical protein